MFRICVAHLKHFRLNRAHQIHESLFDEEKGFMVSLWVTKSRLNHTDPPETHKINTPFIYLFTFITK